MHPAVTRYIVSENLVADTTLLAYDIKASIAHVKMLHKVKLLSKQESEVLIQGLQEIVHFYQENRFQLNQADEDCHTAIENYLVNKLGDVGKKIHMGRSRNDQVLVALRLFAKDSIIQVQKAVLDLTETLLSFGQKHEFMPMPGYTHTQRAMPSSVGQWVGSFVESLLDDYKALSFAFQLNDQNPLGSAAGFGTGLPIDREYTTKLLGFTRTQVNTLYCQNSRGKIGGFTVSTLVQVMLTLSKIANDLIWFTTKEFNFFFVDKSLTTGSSMMPQKQNLDIMEVLRANVSIVLSYQLQIQNVSQNLISGYHKDLKVTKQPLIESFKITMSSLEIVNILFMHLKPNIERLKVSCNPEIYAADEVNELVTRGIPFRDAYKRVGENLKKVKSQEASDNIRFKKHLGATGNLGLDRYEQEIKNLKIPS